MPELPEVETVRQGLAPVMEGFIFEQVILNRINLRFPFADDFIERIQGQTLVNLGRRAKFLNGKLSSGDRLFMHLGMSGRFTIDKNGTHYQNGEFIPYQDTNPKHDHVIFIMSNGTHIRYNDPRRFGFMELIAPDEPSRLDNLGPEPLSNALSAPIILKQFSGKKTSIKSALLDQRNIAGLGNIYVCEALYRAGIDPRRLAGSLNAYETESLVKHIKDVIQAAIEAGGSSLKDFADTDGALGYFQHNFDVYSCENEPCHLCTTPIQRIIQSGRSTFYCENCQN